jgi:hypothetical protein
MDEGWGECNAGAQCGEKFLRLLLSADLAIDIALVHRHLYPVGERRSTSIRIPPPKDRDMNLKKAFLILAFAMVAIIALLYGIDPSWFASTFLGVTDLSVNFAHILRAVMGLYLALGFFWLFAALSDTHKNTAILTTIVFAGGLVSGRLLSFIVDGQPSSLLVFYAALEFMIIPVAWWIYARSE